MRSSTDVLYKVCVNVKNAMRAHSDEQTDTTLFLPVSVGPQCGQRGIRESGTAMGVETEKWKENGVGGMKQLGHASHKGTLATPQPLSTEYRPDNMNVRQKRHFRQSASFLALQSQAERKNELFGNSLSCRKRDFRRECCDDKGRASVKPLPCVSLSDTGHRKDSFQPTPSLLFFPPHQATSSRRDPLFVRRDPGTDALFKLE